MEKEAIEITEKDLIERPATLTPGETPGTGQTPQSVIKAVKDGVKQFKEIADMAKEWGIDIPGLLKGKLGQAGPTPEPPNQQSQFLLVRQLLIAKYGDITINKILERLKADLGDKKLSDLGKGF